MKYSLPPQNAQNQPATSLTPRIYPIHEVNELTRQTNPKWRRTSRNYKTTIPCFPGKNEASKLALVSSGIVRRSRVYRVRGSRGVTMTYLVSLWNVVWLFWLRIDVALWASIVVSVGRKKDTRLKLHFFKTKNHFVHHKSFPERHELLQSSQRASQTSSPSHCCDLKRHKESVCWIRCSRYLAYLFGD